MTDLAGKWLGRCGSRAWPFLVAIAPRPSHAQTHEAAAFVPSVGAAAVTVFVVLLLAAIALGLWWAATAAGRPRLRKLRDRIDRLDMPAAVSRFNGTLLHANAAMRDSSGGLERRIEKTLGRKLGVSPALIYRLARDARDVGFGFEPAEAQSAAGTRVLSARFVEPDLVAWTILPPERVLRLGSDAGAGSADWDPAPFAHLRVEPGGSVRANETFRRRYGDPAMLPAEVIEGDDLPAGRRVLLERPEGGAEPCRIWAFPAATGERRGRDIFIFPVDGRAEAPGAQRVLDAVPVALMQFDLQGRLLWVNGHARDMIGKNIPAGTMLTELVEPLGRSVETVLEETAAGSESRREMVRLRESAFETFLHISLTPVMLDETPSLLAVLSDASELRSLEDKFAQSQKMEAVGKLAGGVAHDFNNVLTAINGHCDLLLLGKDALHPDYSDLMQIRQNTHRAAALVRQLLAFSRKQTLKPELLSVQDVVSDTQYLLNRLIGEKVTLAVEHGHDLWMVRADHQQLEQALMNLVVNARDAMPDGGTVTISTRNLTFDEQTTRQNVEVPAGAYVEITVSDTGIGIPPHVLNRIFEPFFTTKERGEGTGLGLSTVYGIVKQSGGFIFAESPEEGGSRFRLLLPRAQPDEKEDTVPVENLQADRHDLTGKGSVLLVEDDDPVRAFASRALRLRGYEVIEAASAEQAMGFLSDSSNHVDVLVSDVVMPGMDGPTFAAEARKMRSDLRVVFVSGYAEDSFRRNILDNEFLFLPKPFSLTDLTAKVKEALSQVA